MIHSEACKVLDADFADDIALTTDNLGEELGPHAIK
jgi:hypothetical protein